MEKDKHIFSLIVTNAVYAFLKEKYPDYHIIDEDDDKNIKELTSHLSEIESYAHIPDKKLIIKAEYQKIKQYMITSEFREEKLLSSIKENSQDLSIEEKEAVLNSVIYVMHMDKKISKTEKPIILQVAKFLGLDISYKKAIKNYKNFEFKESSFPVKTFIFGLLFLAGIAGGLYWKYLQESNVNTYFEKNELTFSEVYFNKFIIYQNKFGTSEHFIKQAIYHLSGTAEISIDVDNFKFEPVTKTLIVSYQEPSLFNVNINLKNTLEVDRINPKPISKEEAKNLAVVVGFAGAYGGGKAGSSLVKLLGSILPPKYEFIANITGAGLGGIAGGVTGYFISNKLLKGLSLSNEITEKEKSEVINSAKELIKAQMSINPELLKNYKKNFEQFIKLQFKRHGENIKHIKYIRGSK